MNLVSNSQWKGWFSGMGAGGLILQNIITSITPFLVGGLAIYFAVLTFKYGGALSKADGPEQRKEIKTKLFWLVVGLIVTITGPTIVLILMNTTYKTIQVGDSSGTSTTTAKAMKDLIVHSYHQMPRAYH